MPPVREDFDAGELAGNVTWTAPVDDRYVSSYQANPVFSNSVFRISLIINCISMVAFVASS